MRSLDILVVDDEEDIVDIFRAVLEDGGHRVTTAASGEEALGRAAEGAFELVFLDIKLPGMSGLEVLRELRNQRPDCRVVMITGLLDDDVFDLAMFSPRPADGFLTKPCSFHSIRECVRVVLREEAPYIRTPRDEFHYLGAKLQKALAETGWTVATAEVLTAGALSQTLGEIFQFGGTFLGGVAAHGPRALRALLPSLEDPAPDPFTPEGCRALADAVRAHLGADLGLAVTVLSDLYPEEHERPLGSCVVALAGADRGRTVERRFATARPELRRQAVYLAMRELLSSLPGQTGE